MRSALARSRPLWAAIAILSAAAVTLAQNAPDDAAKTRKELDDLVRQNAEVQRKIQELQKRLDTPTPPVKPAQPPAPPPDKQPAPAPKRADQSADEALDRALRDIPSGETALNPKATGDIASVKAGSATLRLIDISFVLDVAAGASTADDQTLSTLQGGGHDPRKRGFTLQAAELALAGAVDPYFTAQSNIVYFIDPLSGDSQVELEEAFLTSQSLPGGLQVRAGQYLTEFGLLNQSHPHTWDWMDQPVVLTRMFGGDGMRAPGARLSWLTPLPWYSQLYLSIQNANGETMPSFLADGESVGGRPYADVPVSSLAGMVIAPRWENFWDLGGDTTLKLGVSGAFGPNSTGPHQRTSIYGADAKFKWHPGGGERGWPFVVWQSEILARDYDAAAATDTTDPNNPIPLAAQTFHDWGFYTQVLYGFTTGWSAGLRYEYGSGSGESVGGRASDPFRDDRQRISPLLVWNMSEFSRLRLQYNYDQTDHLADGHASSIYLGIEVLFGAHPAHNY